MSAADLEGPLCALSLYLSAAVQLSQAREVDRDRLGQALEGAREQIADLAQRMARAGEGSVRATGRSKA